MRPSATYSKVMRVTRRFLSTCGADIVDASYQMNPLTYIVIFWIVIYFFFSVYTCQLTFSENKTIILESFCMVGSVLQGIAKLVSFIVYRGNIQHQCAFLETVYVQFEAKGDKYLLALKKFIHRMLVLVQCVGYLYIVAYLIAIILPPIIWVFTRRHLFVMQFSVPRVDKDTSVGYFITIVAQSICMFFGAFGNCAGDMVMMVFCCHSVLLADIFKFKTEELNEITGSLEAAEKLVDVINWHQTYEDFLARCGGIFFWINFVQISTSGMNIVLTLVIVFTGYWPGAYGYIAISFCMLYVYCGIGTLTVITNDRITDDIYAIYWYRLRVSEQKAIQFMLMKSQSAIQMSVGGVAPLSVNTGLQVTKTVYSVFMMLLNSFD